MGEQMKVDAKKATETKKKSKWGPFLGGLVVGLPVGLLAFLKWVCTLSFTSRLSPDFFHQCESEYPKAMSYLRKYVPLNWPEQEVVEEVVEEEEGPITVTIKEDELEEQIRNLLHSMEEKETIDGVDVERIISVLVAAREMLLEEKQALAVCPVSPSDILEEEKPVEATEATPEPPSEPALEEIPAQAIPAKETPVEAVESSEPSEPSEPSEWHITFAAAPEEGEWGFTSLLREVREELRELKEVRQEVRAVRRDDVHELVREIEEEIEEVKEELNEKKKEESSSEERKSVPEVKESTPEMKEDSSNEESELMERAERVLKAAEAAKEAAAKPEEHVEVVEEVEMVEQPTEEPEKPAEESAEPVEESVDEPADQLIEEASSEPAKPIEEPAKLIEEPAKPIEEPAKPIDQPIDQPTKKPTIPTQQPAKPIPQPDAFGFSDWSRATAVLEQARRRLLPAVSPAILQQVETAIEEGMSSVTQQLNAALASSQESEVREAIAQLEQQLREATVEEANRLYSVLSEQRRELETRFEDELAATEAKVRQAVREELSAEEKEEVARTLQEYKARVTAIQRGYIDHLDDLVYAEEMLEKGRRLQKEAALREELQAASAVETADLRRTMAEDAEEKSQVRVGELSHFQTLKETQRKVAALAERIERTRRVFEEVLLHQERQRAFLHLQQAALHGETLQEATTALQRKAGDDVILQHLLGKIPASVREKGLPPTVHYLTEFEALRPEARAASKTAEDASFAGQLLGRAVVSMVGTEGVDPSDPLVQIERMGVCLSEWASEGSVRRRGDLRQAYAIGSQLEGGSRAVLADWLAEVKERLDFETAMREIQLHLEREATYVNMDLSRLC